MKRKIIPAGLLCLLLCCWLAAAACAQEWLSLQEAAEMRALIGVDPDPASVSLSFSPDATANEAIFGLGWYMDDMTVDDRLASCLGMLEYAEGSENAALKQRVLDIRNTLYRDGLEEMNYCFTQLNNAAARLETLLDLLEDPEAELKEMTKASYAAECRFLRRTISDYVAKASELQDTVPAAITKAGEELDAVKPELDRAIRSVLDRSSAEAGRLRAQEHSALRLSAGDAADDQPHTDITVIDANSFAFTVRTGPGDKDVLQGAEVTVYNDEKKTSEKGTTDENGVVSFPVSHYNFDDGKAQVHAEVRAKGYRDVCYRGARVTAGSAVVIPLEKDDETPYMREASVNNDDLLHDSGILFVNIPNSRHKYTLSFGMARLPANAKVTVYVEVIDPNVKTDKGEEYVDVKLGGFTTDENGNLNLEKEDYFADLLKVREKGDSAAASLQVIVKKDGTQVGVFPMAGKISRALFEEPISLDSSVPSMTPGTFGLKLPSLDPVFSNPSMNIGSPLLPPVEVKLDADGTLVVGIGMQKGNRKEIELLDGYSVPARDLSLAEISNIYSSSIQAEDDTYRSSRSTDKIVKLGGINGCTWDWHASVGIIAKFEWRSDGHLPMTGNIWVGGMVSGTLAYTQCFFIPPPVSVPCYLGIDFTASVSVGFEGGVTAKKNDDAIEDFDVQGNDQFTVNFDFELGISAGVGLPGLLSMGVRAFGDFGVAFIFQPKPSPGVSGNIYWQLSYGAGLDFEIKALLVDITIHVLSYSDTTPDKPEPFIADQVTVAGGAAAGNPAVLPAASSALTRLPAEGEVLSLPVREQIVRAFGEGEGEGIRPERETVYDGRFAPTELKSVTMDNGKGGYVNFVFSAGSKTQNQLGYSSVNYSSSEEDRMVLRGAAFDTAGDYGFISEFDVSYSEGEKILYLLTIYGNGTQNGDAWTVDETQAYVSAFMLNDDGKTLTKKWENQVTPTSEAGNSMPVFLAKPVVKAGKDKNNHGASFAMIGTDLSDRDDKGEALGHDPGTYFYVGTMNEYTDTFWRLNNLRLDDNEEVIRLIFLPRPVLINDPPGNDICAFSYEIAALTGVKDSLKLGQTRFDYNRIREQAVGVLMKRESLYKARYLPNGHEPADWLKTATVDKIQASNIMPGYGDEDLFVVAYADGGAVTEDEGRESTLDVYTFPRGTTTWSKTNLGFTTSMNWFGEANIAGGNYLYWLKTYDSDDRNPNKAPPRYVIRACLYDQANNCFTDPFDLVELSYSPRTVALASGAVNNQGEAMGLYTISADPDGDSDSNAWTFVDMDYRLKTCLDLLALCSETHCATAGKDTDLTLSVKNSGNTLVAAFDVNLTEKSGEKLGTVHVNALNPSGCSVELYELNGTDDEAPVFTAGPESVYSTDAGTYGACSRLVLTTSDDGNVTTKELITLGLVPGHTATYQISVSIPESWKSSKREIFAEVANVVTPQSAGRVFVSQEDTEDLDPGVFSPREIAAAIQAAEPALAENGVPAAANRAEVEYARNDSPNASGAMGLNYDNLALNMRLVRFPDGDYVEARISNAADAGEAGVPPTLTFTAEGPDGRGQTVFSHTFANSVHSGFGYTLLLPLDLVDGDGAYTRLTGEVSGGAGHREANYYNNRKSLAGSLHTITVLTEGPGKAFAQDGTGKRVTSAETGEKIFLAALPGAGASLIEWRTGTVELAEDGSFIMPAYDVVITAVFGPPLLIVKGPEDAWINSGERATFRVAAKGEELTYQWYVNKTRPANRNADEGWERLPGATGDVYRTEQMKMNTDGYLYRCVVKDRYGRRVTTGAAMLHIRIPVTGDPGNPLLWLGLILAGVTGLWLLMKSRRP